MNAKVTRIYGTRGKWAIILDEGIDFDPNKKQFITNEGE